MSDRARATDQGRFVPATTADVHLPGVTHHNNNLPIQLSSFIGRKSEIAQVKRFLSDSRLVTLTGAGGCGKTRLALRVADDLTESYADGVWFIDLAPLADPALVPQAVAVVLSVREERGQPILNSLVDHLSARNLLLVLDNCEHLIDACSRLADTLLRACPNLRILATSREALGISGETAWTVLPLSVPDLRQAGPMLANLSQYEAVQLFVARAAAVEPRFQLMESNAAAVAQVCRRLDGIPLAIELAAARVKVLSVDEIAARLDDRFHLLILGSRTALPRHQTLRAAVDWSYDLLTEREQVLLGRLSVFVGGCTLRAAEAVCSLQDAASGEVESPPSLRLLPTGILDLLSQLVDKSLLFVDRQGGETRYQMLETIRQYASDKLIATGDAERVRHRHLDFFLALAEEANPQLSSLEAIAWGQRLERENDNMRAALEWSLSSGAIETGLSLAVALSQYWQIRGYLREGQAWFGTLLSRSSETSDLARAWAFQSVGFLSSYQDDVEQAARFFEQALALSRRLDSKRGMASALVWLGWLAETRGDLGQAHDYAAQSLALSREVGDPWWPAVALFCLAEVAFLQGNLELAVTTLEESLAICRQVGNLWGAGRRLTRLGQVTFAQGDPTRAFTLLQEGLLACRQAGDRSGMGWALAGLAGLARAEGEVVWAVRLLGSVATLREEAGAALWFLDRREFERHVMLAREELSPEVFDAAWAAGRALNLDQAVQYALELPRQPEVRPRLSRRAARQEFGGLTRRERQVAARIGQGESNREIAQEFVLSQRTVETHVANILNKLGFTGRAQIRKWAVEKGLVKRAR